MAKSKRPSTVAGEITARRKFMRQMGEAAVTAPAVALLVAASSQPAAAQYRVQTLPRRTRQRRRPSGVMVPTGDE